MSNVSDDSSSYGYFDFTEYCADQSFATLAVFNISLTIIGLITGIFLLAVVVKNPALRGDKFLLLNQLLCVSIVLLSVAGIIYTEEAIYPCWYIGRFFCKLFSLLDDLPNQCFHLPLGVFGCTTVEPIPSKADYLFQFDSPTVGHHDRHVVGHRRPRQHTGIGAG